MTSTGDERKSWPLVTVALPVYNGSSSLRRAVASAVDQGYPNLEILISDNASTDATASICRELILSDARISCYRHPRNIGIMANFAFLLGRARGEYFIWLAHDDQIAPDALTRYVSFMRDNRCYSLISGSIEYSEEGTLRETEKGFDFRQRSPALRVLAFYSKVVHGAMFHGLMRTSLARRVPLRNVLGGDWHFVASLAFMGKVHNPNYVGYRKRFGGTSVTLRHYAKAIGESRLAGRFPHLKIAIDAFAEIASRSPVYASLHVVPRTLLGLAAAVGVIGNFGLRIYPFIIGGRIRRFLIRIVSGLSRLTGIHHRPAKT